MEVTADVRRENELVGGTDALRSAKRTVATERAALDELGNALTGTLASAFIAAVEVISTLRGRVVVSGMGKSGLVGRKIAATLASTGTPAFFLHPADASHGDLGMITPDDVALILSWSGETSELNDLVTYCGRFTVPIVALTSRKDSTLARIADVQLVAPDVQEACPNGLAPTSSTTLQMVLGDALAVALIEHKGFSVDDFRRFHPKGRLGAQLLTVADLMTTGEALPTVDGSAIVLDAAIEMNEKRLGVAAIIDCHGRLIGAFTDGDLRRSLTTSGPAAVVRDHMSATPHRAEPKLLASEAIGLMNQLKISQLFICRDEVLIGIVHLHDLLRAGVA